MDELPGTVRTLWQELDCVRIFEKQTQCNEQERPGYRITYLKPYMVSAMRFAAHQQTVPLQTSFASTDGAAVPALVSFISTTGVPAPSPAFPTSSIPSRPFKFMLETSRKIAGFFGVNCEDCPSEGSLWGCYVTLSCWKVVVVTLGAAFLFFAFLLGLFFLGQVDDLMLYQRHLLEYEAEYPTLGKLFIGPIRVFHKVYIKTYERSYKSLERKFGNRPWFKFVAVIPCTCLRGTWRVFQKILQPTCRFCLTWTKTSKTCIAETGLCQWASDKFLKKSGCRADPIGDAKRKERAEQEVKEAEKQSKIDAEEAKKQAKIDAKEAKKQAKIDAKEAQKEAKNKAEEEEKEAEMEAKEKEAKETRKKARKEAKEEAQKKDEEEAKLAEEKKLEAPAAPTAPSPPPPPPSPLPTAPPGMPPAVAVATAPPAMYGAPAQQYAADLYAAYGATAVQGYGSYNNPMYSAEQYGQAAQGQSPYGVAEEEAKLAEEKKLEAPADRTAPSPPPPPPPPPSPLPTAPPGMPPAVAVATAPPAMYGAPAQQYAADLYAAYGATAVQGYGSYNNPMYSAEQYGQAAQGQSPYGVAAQGESPYGAAAQGQSPYGAAAQGQNPYGAAQEQSSYGAAAQGQYLYGAAAQGYDPYSQQQPGAAPDPNAPYAQQYGGQYYG